VWGDLTHLAITITGTNSLKPDASTQRNSNGHVKQWNGSKQQRQWPVANSRLTRKNKLATWQ
jgi:hypothetical protein